MRCEGEQKRGWEGKNVKRGGKGGLKEWKREREMVLL